ncbi:LysR family transcriptional regulator [Mycobacterium simiae]|uniref:Probable hydrogen peroxide-inducible genes activator n=1 Tax=Mycobacterium simiae TaxID=1784 RepID=A0A5B1BWE9_MYCSI|nr:LysR family transcriptional regulator [Mycobacterium simiae]KAA1251750.1 LysR family transcriptional regulator [Mycobacterium simiae]
MLNLRHLSNFVTVVEAGSFSRAAQKIYIAQPSLSQQIASLEAQLGAALLLRSARGVRPTAQGEVLYREALNILRQVEALPVLLGDSVVEPAGVVALGISTAMAPIFATDILRECAEALPKVRIVLESADGETIAAMIANRQMDLGVVFEIDPLPRLARRQLYRQRLYLFAARSEMIEKPAEVALTENGIVCPPASSILHQGLERALAARGLPFVPQTEAMTYFDILSAVRTGSRITLLPRGELDVTTFDLATPVALEPALYLTGSIVSSDEYPLSRPADAIAAIIERVIVGRAASGALRGAELIAQPVRP